MKKLILPAVGLALIATAAFAQTERPPAPPSAVDQQADQGPGPMPGPMAEGDAAGGPPPPPPGGPRGPAGHGWFGGPGHGPDHAPDRGPPPPPSKAAHFRIERGDLRLDVKCAEDEPSRICSDTMLTLLDKLAAAPAPR